MILKKSTFAGCLLTLTLVSGMFAAHASETPNKTSQPAATEKTEAATEKTEKAATKKAATKKAAKTEKSAKININTATAKMLKTLKGIGPKKAQDIVNYRQKHGKFQSLEDLKKVPGIGDKTFEKNRHQITIGQPAQKAQPKANNSPATGKSPQKPATTNKSGKSGTDKSGKSEKPGKNQVPANKTPDKKAAPSASKNQNPVQSVPKVKPL